MSRIQRIETIRLGEHPRTLWVQVVTDDGLVGLGETYYVPGAVSAVIHDIAAPHLLGQSPFDLERAWTTLFQETNFYGYAGAEMRAISASKRPGRSSAAPPPACRAARPWRSRSSARPRSPHPSRGAARPR
jgi:hypothetical protein